MVKRRGNSRRANAPKGQPTKTPSNDTNLENGQDPVPFQNETKGSNDIDALTISSTKLQGLISEKSLFVKMVDIQTNMTKGLAGVQFSPSNLQAAQKNEKKGCGSNESVVNSMNISNAGIVSRVVTRSRRGADNKNCSVDQTTTVSVVKTPKRNNKNNTKHDQIRRGSKEALGDSDHSSQSTENESVRCEPIFQTEDDDPCLSGDIMYEQVIEDINDDPETSASNSLPLCDTENVFGKCQNSVQDGSKNLDTNLDNDQCSKLSSSSDQVPTTSGKITCQNICVPNDDTNVTSSSTVSDPIDIVSSVVNNDSNEISSDSSLSNSDVIVSQTATQNIEALSSLKLDPGVEPVSSSKIEPFFGPIFSIEENSEEQVMEIDSVNIERECHSANADEMSKCTEDRSLSDHSDSSDPMPKTIPTLPIEKVMTRSRATMNSPGKSNATTSPSNKTQVKRRTKGKLKEMDISEDFTCVDSFYPNKNTDICDDNVNIKTTGELNAMDIDDNTKESGSSDLEVPLVVNRCITETRKYTGPKGTVKNNFCTPSEASSVGQGVSSTSLDPADLEYHSDKITEKVVCENECPLTADKNIPMSPKELFMKNYSSQIIADKVEVELVSSVDVTGGDSTKADALSLKELIMMNYSTDAYPDTAIEADNSSNPPDKIAEASVESGAIIEQNVRRSRRNSAEKAKRTLNLAAFGPKKDVISSKVQDVSTTNSNDSKSIRAIEKSDTNFQKVDKVVPQKGPKPKTLDKLKKDIVTMSSILNEKSKPMSPKELIKKSFIANESRSMEPPKIDTNADKSPVKCVVTGPGLDDNGNDVEKTKMASPLLTSTDSPSPLDTKKTELTSDKDKSDLKSDILVSNVIMNFDSDKPVKVKSRWRRTSELEMGKIVNSEPMDIDSSSLLSLSDDQEVKLTSSAENEKIDEAIVAQRMNSFIHIESNEYLTERYDFYYIELLSVVKFLELNTNLTY